MYFLCLEVNKESTIGLESSDYSIKKLKSIELGLVTLKIYSVDPGMIDTDMQATVRSKERLPSA